jgi:hypothetical protein
LSIINLIDNPRLKMLLARILTEDRDLFDIGLETKAVIPAMDRGHSHSGFHPDICVGQR